MATATSKIAEKNKVNTASTKSKKVDVYEKITNKVMDLLENGVVPWQKPWKGGISAMPSNFKSKRRYSGINLMFLSMVSYDFTTPYFLTFKQAKEMGGMVKKGSTGFEIVYASKYFKTVENEETGKKSKEERFVYKTSTVFNLDQIEGIEAPIENFDALEFSPIEEAEKLVNQAVKNGIPAVIHKGHQAYYSPGLDRVVLPPQANFNSVNEYYSTLFHEMTHSTGHKDRLDREMNAHKFGDEIYSKEELTAEFGNLFMCGLCGIESTVNNSVSYLKGWLKALKNDKKLLISAASKAQKAVDFMTKGMED